MLASLSLCWLGDRDASGATMVPFMITELPVISLLLWPENYIISPPPGRETSRRRMPYSAVFTSVRGMGGERRGMGQLQPDQWILF